MRFHPLLMLAVVPAFLFASCSDSAKTDHDGHDHDQHEGHDHSAAVAEDDYHATGNCAMEFTIVLERC